MRVVAGRFRVHREKCGLDGAGDGGQEGARAGGAREGPERRMMQRRATRIAALAVVAAALSGEGLMAEKPPLGKRRKEIATHIFTGRVVKVESERKVVKRMNLYEYEYTYHTATIAVSRITRSPRRNPVETLEVRSWKSRYLGRGPQPPGLGGHFHVPEAGEVVKVYARERGKVLNVLEPDGYVVLREVPKDSGPSS